MNHLYYAHNTHVGETALTTTYSLVWSGDVILAYALFNCSSDDIDLAIFNGDAECMTFNLDSMKADYRLDSDLYNPVLRMYAPNRWALDFRQFGGVYPQGTLGVQIKMKSTAGSKTLDNAMIFWSTR